MLPYWLSNTNTLLVTIRPSKGHTRQPKLWGWMRNCIKKFPLLLKEGWSWRLIILYIQYSISRPGWLIHWFLPTFIGMKTKTSLTGKALISSDHHLSSSAAAVLWKWAWWKSQSTTPAGISICIIIKKWSGHPSFKRRGNVSGIYSILYIQGCDLKKKAALLMQPLWKKQ